MLRCTNGHKDTNDFNAYEWLIALLSGYVEQACLLGSSIESTLCELNEKWVDL